MRRLSVALLLLAALGCGDSGADLTLGPTDPDVTGAFSLQSSGGYALPVLAGYTADGQTEIDMTADRITIAADNTWSELTTYQLTSLVSGSATTETHDSSGSYTISNGQIAFIMTVGGTQTFTGSVSGRTLTVIYRNNRLVYTR